MQLRNQTLPGCMAALLLSLCLTPVMARDINLTRLESTVQGKLRATAGVVYPPEFDFQDPQYEDKDHSLVAHGGLCASAAASCGTAKAIAGPFIAEIVLPPGIAYYTAQHFISSMHSADYTRTCLGLSAVCDVATTGHIQATYSTHPNFSTRPNPKNKFATLQGLLHLNAIGPPEQLDVTDNEQGFFQRIQLAGSSIEATYLGSGIFTLTGSISQSSESSPNAAPLLINRTSLGLNALFRCQERIPRNSGGKPAVEVELRQTEHTQLSESLAISPFADPNGNFADSYIWTFGTMASFHVRDFSDSDSTDSNSK